MVCIEKTAMRDKRGMGNRCDRNLRPENPTQTAVNRRVDIDCLAQGLEGKGCLSVGKDEKQQKQFPVGAAGRGDDCRQGVGCMGGTLVCMAWHFASRTQPYREPPKPPNWAL